MLRYALRRALWAIPTLVATSLILFLVTTLAPDPAAPATAAEAREPAADASLEEQRRSRFLDLPRFVNTDPQDVRSRAREALAHVAAGDARELLAGASLCRLGGAALPFILPLLESLPPDARGRVAVSLLPIAERMGVTERPESTRPEQAVLFWTRFWDDRELDFSRAAVARAVSRLVEHESDTREHDLVALDTFALPELVEALKVADDRRVLERLTRLLNHAAGRGRVVSSQASEDSRGETRRILADWREWWFVHNTDFAPIDGPRRAIAFLTDTRYGKWLDRARTGELGISAIDGEPIADKLRARAPITVLVCTLATLISCVFSVPLGALGAWRRGGPFDVTSFAVLFLLYATPTFAVAEVLRRAMGVDAGEGTRIALAVAALGIGSLATLSRWQRGAMLEVVRQDYVRTAHAKGLSAARVAVVHALRNALLPMVTLAGLHVPTTLGGSFVVEEVFGLPGVGSETMRAIAAHDSPWLMAILLGAAVTVTLGLIASDVGCGMLDPRVREVFARRTGGLPK